MKHKDTIRIVDHALNTGLMRSIRSIRSMQNNKRFGYKVRARLGK